MLPREESLEELQRKREARRGLQTVLTDLYGQRGQLKGRVRELEEAKREAQEDVDRLEGGSLAAFFYRVVGKQDEKLKQERQEAYAAAVKYDAAVQELGYVEQTIAGKEQELNGLGDVEARYRQALERKRAAVKAGGGPVADEILALEERNAWLDQQIQELQEALRAGSAALTTTDQILDSLDSAHGWGTWDLVGGGMLADIAKHDHLDSAQYAVGTLQVQLRKFRTELADVRIDGDIQVQIDGFLRFADFFFDGLFADWAVMDQISRSQDQVQRTRSQIGGVMEKLQRMERSAQQERRQNSARLEELVVQA